jgi:predicted phosphate transport protein (TIGR00153 family)
MLSFLFKKQHKVEALIFKYLDTLQNSRNSFDDAMRSCVLNGVMCADFDFHIQQTHKHESRADDIRDEIVGLMYGKAMIPESRGDILGLLATLDLIPECFEHILYDIQTQKLVMPPPVLADLEELIHISLDSCDILFELTRALFDKRGGIRDLVQQIDRHESHCDHIARRLLSKLFTSDEDPLVKMQIKVLMEKIEAISNRADDVAKRIMIISMKRRV